MHTRRRVDTANLKAVSTRTAAPGRGFTLLEIAFSVVVLTVLAASVLAFFGTTTRIQTTNREREVARTAAGSKMEEILAWLDYATLFDNFSGTTFSAGTLQAPGGGPPGAVIIDNTDPNLLSITVRVTWIGPSEITDTFKLSTSITNIAP